MYQYLTWLLTIDQLFEFFYIVIPEIISEAKLHLCTFWTKKGVTLKPDFHFLIQNYLSSVFCINPGNNVVILLAHLKVTLDQANFHRIHNKCAVFTFSLLYYQTDQIYRLLAVFLMEAHTHKNHIEIFFLSHNFVTNVLPKIVYSHSDISTLSSLLF